jgi:hypothetical protein
MPRITICTKDLSHFQEMIARYERYGWVRSTPITRSIKQGTFRAYVTTMEASETRGFITWLRCASRLRASRLLWKIAPGIRFHFDFDKNWEATKVHNDWGDGKWAK